MLKPARILVELDCLLDTRLGTLAKINPEEAIKVLDNGYFTREWDNFPGFNKTEFDEAYHARDEETLQNSILTGMYFFLMSRFSDIRKQIIDRRDYDGIELLINVYPYKLDDDTKDAIGLAMASHFTTIESVKVVDMEYKEISPTYCANELTALVLYDWDTWTNAQVDWITKDGCSLPKNLAVMFNVTVWAPALYKVEPPTKDELDKHMAEMELHPLKVMEQCAAALYNLVMISPRYFCLMREGVNDEA